MQYLLSYIILYKQNLNLYLTILLFSLALTFLSGLSYTKTTFQTIDNNSWYFINSGLPLSFSGNSMKEKQVSFPFIKIPWVINQDYSGNSWNKVIMLPFFIVNVVLYILLITLLFKKRLISLIDKSKLDYLIPLSGFVLLILSIWSWVKFV